ncbi:N-acetylmuramoyl-L-alanine amidase [Epibacterium sp. SM1979]|uniref:N-acetylmuramoyl-L-alanine amidase n=1 Tax=Tritonibacter litoralis TaxID=2662264 RepID=A0A843Y9W4_9RHOB|nr:N-acetylmuramoyl-L-alanine amidase [Tritonibacter litoralis]MQQ07716.1 N-acetylmuramoyl-L-alanine amidase [Tritonibacter litoralis]
MATVTPAVGIRAPSAWPLAIADPVESLTPIQHPSPNFGPRRDGLTPSLVVIHYTAMTSATAALDRLCDPVAEVSAHYLISRTGTLWQLVDEDMRAWHAGVGEWAGEGDINSRSIGIELDNTGAHPFPEPQMRQLERVLTQIQTRWAIPARGIIGHSDMAPGRKFDPGPKFDWPRLARQNLAMASSGQTAQDANWPSFRAAAHLAGFTAPCDNQTLLRAVRLRHRPHATGPLTAADFAALPSG